MRTEIDSDRDLILLEQIEYDPDVTQASLAATLGVAVGTVNWHIKRFVAKGYVKVKRAQRRKLRYIITPEGLAFRAHLTLHYIDTTMRLYRRTRQHVRELLNQVIQSGYKQVIIDGDGDIADICKLTCLEHGIQVIDPQLAEKNTQLAEKNAQLAEKNPQLAEKNAQRQDNVQVSYSTNGFPVLEVQGTKIHLRLKS